MDGFVVLDNVLPLACPPSFRSTVERERDLETSMVVKFVKQRRESETKENGRSRGKRIHETKNRKPKTERERKGRQR